MEKIFTSVIPKKLILTVILRIKKVTKNNITIYQKSVLRFGGG